MSDVLDCGASAAPATSQSLGIYAHMLSIIATRIRWNRAPHPETVLAGVGSMTPGRSNDYASRLLSAM